MGGTDASERNRKHLETAREVFEIECEALRGLSTRIGEEFAEAVDAILSMRGSLVVCGVGKSGIVARKIAATFSSTGTPAVFMHPAEAAHGDIGAVSERDVVLAVSKSGEGEELAVIMPVLKGLGVRLIAITGNTSSSLAKASDIVLDAGVEREACPMDIVPTASTTAALAVGDALAVAVMKEKDVDPERFAHFHPGGALGRRLLLRVRDVMHAGDDVPVIGRDRSMQDAIYEIANKRLGMTAVVDEGGRLVGILTDGDLKRILLRRHDILTATVSEVMTHDPRTIGRDELVATALEQMETGGPSPITSHIVVDSERRPEGVIHIHDCLKAVG